MIPTVLVQCMITLAGLSRNRSVTHDIHICSPWIISIAWETLISVGNLRPEGLKLEGLMNR